MLVQVALVAIAACPALVVIRDDALYLNRFGVRPAVVGAWCLLVALVAVGVAVAVITGNAIWCLLAVPGVLLHLPTYRRDLVLSRDVRFLKEYWTLREVWAGDEAASAQLERQLARMRELQTEASADLFSLVEASVSYRLAGGRDAPEAANRRRATIGLRLDELSTRALGRNFEDL